MNKPRDRIMRLKRRANWLEARAAITADKGLDCNLDKKELSAIRWAVEILEEKFGKAPDPVDN